MKKVAAFIDFTEGCKIALKQASIVAKALNAELCAVYIMSDSGDITAKENEILNFASSVQGISAVTPIVGTGELLEESSHVLRKLSPELVVIGTHGIKGIKQQLFGAHILKLVQAIPFPCIVVQENSKPAETGWKNILMPVSAHQGYALQVKQTVEISKYFQSQIIQYEIDKPAVVEDIQHDNIKTAREFFHAQHIPFVYIIEEPTVVSVGNSRQELKYAHENQVDLISALSEIPQVESSLAKAEMENLLTNEFGIPVLCCNE